MYLYIQCVPGSREVTNPLFFHIADISEKSLIKFKLLTRSVLGQIYLIYSIGKNKRVIKDTLDSNENDICVRQK